MLQMTQHHLRQSQNPSQRIMDLTLLFQNHRTRTRNPRHTELALFLSFTRILLFLPLCVFLQYTDGTNPSPLRPHSNPHHLLHRFWNPAHRSRQPFLMFATRRRVPRWFLHHCVYPQYRNGIRASTPCLYHNRNNRSGNTYQIL